jgi:hypothetical protein
VKSHGRSDKHFIADREKEHLWLEGSQASPAPPDKSESEDVGMV